MDCNTEQIEYSDPSRKTSQLSSHNEIVRGHTSARGGVYLSLANEDSVDATNKFWIVFRVPQGTEITEFTGCVYERLQLSIQRLVIF